MDILYLLIPLSAVLVLAILGVFGWALFRGQFEDLEGEGARILESESATVDADQSMLQRTEEQSPTARNVSS
ncbi:MAG: cbb3-type cytochrome oxidase assembly protein CcoS [Burkholderiaceae bacterium]|uniref:Cbb3-type cytochrome oxidase assembly protein CcoS n=1 Tax=Rubrivivax albus TaxID=2499835 RepID=A0A3S2WWQ2_9BURK|nr:cbb3-type cytochrome oxidase assembly protein CcoS [Rubrivivax albus]MCP5270155.1 cbb3-type cytochrome oxidase assembly protein CcoS [Burkholderiaceae bacterium]RVT47713.1 cbb3-type cytochrome oxidase assembly protein CcoS [Rubrivivax albus]